MSKEFYTEKDIEDLFQRGIRSLQVSENVVLTELAYEKAHRLGLQLVSDRAANPPAAPVRPYLSEAGTGRAQPAAAPVAPAMPQPQPAPSGASDVEKRIRSAVVAKLGNQVDTKLLDNIIHRVVKGVGLK
jgi:hypothetical protein